MILRALLVVLCVAQLGRCAPVTCGYTIETSDELCLDLSSSAVPTSPADIADWTLTKAKYDASRTACPASAPADTINIIEVELEYDHFSELCVCPATCTGVRDLSNPCIEADSSYENEIQYTLITPDFPGGFVFFPFSCVPFDDALIYQGTKRILVTPEATGASVGELCSELEIPPSATAREYTPFVNAAVYDPLTDWPFEGTSAIGSFGVGAADSEAQDPLCHRRAKINIFPFLTATLNTAVAPTCNGGSDGSATIDICGGSDLYQLRSTVGTLAAGTPFPGSVTIDGLSETTYTVDFRETGDNRCEGTLTFTVPTKPALIFSIVGQDADCSGETGSIVVSATTANDDMVSSSFTVIIDGVPDTVVGTATSTPAGYVLTFSKTYNGFSAGSYSVVVEDPLGCSGSGIVSVSIPSQVVTGASAIAETCAGLNNGRITITASGGSESYTFEIVNTATVTVVDSGGFSAPSGMTGSITRNNFPPGSYEVRVQDDSVPPCPKSPVPISVTVNPATAIGVSFTVTQTPTCYDSSNGEGEVEVTSGGVAPFTFAFSGSGCSVSSLVNVNAGPHTVNDFCEAVYTVTVTDSTSCSSTAMADFSGASPMFTVMGAQSVIATCADTMMNAAEVTLSVSDTFTVNLFLGAAMVDSASGTSDLFTFTGLAPGSYSAEAVRTVPGGTCTEMSASFTVSDPAKITATAVTGVDTSCNTMETGFLNNGQITFNVINNGVGTVTWTLTDSSLGTTTGTGSPITGLAPDTYSLTVEDDNCVSDGVSVTVGQPSPITLGVTLNRRARVMGSTPANCRALIRVACSPNCDSLTSVPAFSSSCSSGSTSCDTIFAYNDPDPTFELTRAGTTCTVSVSSFVAFCPITYSVSVSDATCATGQHDAGGADGGFSIEAMDVSGNTNCGGATNFRYSGSGLTAMTTMNAAVYSGLEPNTYNVNVRELETSIGGLRCVLQEPVTVGSMSSEMVLTVNEVKETCQDVSSDGSVQVSVSGGTSTFDIVIDGTTFPNVASMATRSNFNGNDNGGITVTDSNGCQASDSFTVPMGNVVTFTVTQTPSLCATGGGNGGLSGTVTGGAPNYVVTAGAMSTSTTSAFSFTGLPVGTTVSVVDSDLCAGTGPSPAVSVLDRELSITLTDDSCSGVASATVSTVDGVHPTTVAIMASGPCGGNQVIPLANSGDTAALSGVAAGCLYSATATDAAGCMVTTSRTIADPIPTMIMATFSLTDPTCVGYSNGRADVTGITGGDGAPYAVTFQGNPFSFGSFPQTLSNMLPDGTYDIVVADTNALCTETISFTLNDPPAVSFTTSPTDTTCHTGETHDSIPLPDGQIAMSDVSAGITGYVTRNSGMMVVSSSNPATGLAPGTYEITATNGAGCTGSSMETVGEPAAIDVMSSGAATTCNPNDDNYMADGTVTLTSNGRTSAGGFNFDVTEDGSSIFTCAGATSCTTGMLSSAGEAYSVNLFAVDNGCRYEEAFAVTSPPAVTVSAVDVSCNAASNVRVTVGGGAFSSYDIVVFDNLANTIGTATGVTGTVTVATGSYQGMATVRVLSGTCYTETTLTLTFRPLLVVNQMRTVDLECFGDSDAAIELTISSGRAPFTIDVDGSTSTTSMTTVTVTGLDGGPHTIIVSDSALGCPVQQETFNVNVPEPAELIISATPTDVTCNGDSDGSVAVSSVGGTGGVTLGGDATSGLAPGMYTYTVTDTNMCMDSITVTIGEPTSVTASVAQTGGYTCGSVPSDGELTVTFGGGTSSGGTYTVDVAGPTSSTSSQTSPFVVANADPGMYTVMVSDDRNCPSPTASVTIPIPTITVNGVPTDESAAGNADGQLAITVSGGAAQYMVSISGDMGTNRGPQTTVGGMTTFITLPAETYTVTAVDNDNCPGMGTFTVGTVPMMTLGLVVTPLTCAANDGAVEVTVSGGLAPFTITLNPGGLTSMVNPATFNMLTPGTYTVQAVDFNGIVSPSSMFTLTLASILQISLTDQTCGAVGAVQVDITGGTPFSTMPDTYMLSHSPNDGTPTSGSTVQSSTLVDGLTPGTLYTFTATDNAGCVVMDSIAPDPSVIALVVTTNPADTFCEIGPGTGSVSAEVMFGNPPYFGTLTDGTTTLSAGPSNPTVVFSNLVSGTYDLTITDSSGCFETVNGVMIGFSFPEIAVAAGEKDIAQCRNDATGTLVVSARNSFVVDVQPPSLGGFSATNVFQVAGGVNYTITVENAFGCQGVGWFEVPNPPELIITASILSPVTCFGQSDGVIRIEIEGGEPDYVLTIDPVPPGSSLMAVNNIPGPVFPATSVTVDITGLSSETFDFSVTDARMCTRVIDDFSLDQPGRLILRNPEKRIHWNMYEPQMITWDYFGGGRDDFLQIELSSIGSTSPYTNVLRTTQSARRGVVTGVPFLPHHLFPGRYHITLRGICVNEDSGVFYIDNLDINSMGFTHKRDAFGVPELAPAAHGEVEQEGESRGP